MEDLTLDQITVEYEALKLTLRDVGEILAFTFAEQGLSQNQSEQAAGRSVDRLRARFRKHLAELKNPDPNQPSA